MLPPCLGLAGVLYVLNLYLPCSMFLLLLAVDGAFGALICVIDYGLGFDR